MLKISILQRYLKKSDLFGFLGLDNDGKMWYPHTPARTRTGAPAHARRRTRTRRRTRPPIFSVFLANLAFLPI